MFLSSFASHLSFWSLNAMVNSDHTLTFKLLLAIVQHTTICIELSIVFANFIFAFAFAFAFNRQI
jgi:hypothetical protein